MFYQIYSYWFKIKVVFNPVAALIALIVLIIRHLIVNTFLLYTAYNVIGYKILNIFENPLLTHQIILCLLIYEVIYFIASYIYNKLTDSTETHVEKIDDKSLKITEIIKI